MTTKKKSDAPRSRKKGSPMASQPLARAVHSEEYDKALAVYQEGLELFHAGKWSEAAQLFGSIEEAQPDERELVHRAQTYALICERKLAVEPEPPRTADECYYRGVVLANDGKVDEALRLLDKAVELAPDSARNLYARASAHALKRQAQRAAADLRLAVEREPVLRFQAANDPDFENVRDEAAFIDVIEPTPTGA